MNTSSFPNSPPIATLANKLTVGSLFAGIGGFDLGLEMTGGFEIAWQIEKDPFCQQVLAKHWPHVTRYGDIRDCGERRKHHLAPVDVLCGGFPCQPHSLAGRRKASKDERDLWPEFARLIRELKPRWVLGENVLGLLSSENGRFFGAVLRDLAQARYDATWCVLRACDVGAPHQRKRVFIVAYAQSAKCQWSRDTQQWRPGFTDSSASMAYATSEGYTNRGDRGGNTTLPETSLYDAEHSNPNVADASSTRRWQSPQERDESHGENTGWQEAPGGLELSGDALAHASSTGQQECNAATITDAPGHAAWRRSAPGSVRPVESSTGRRERQHQESRGEGRTQSLTLQSGARDAQSLLCRVFDGLSDWMDRSNWPAGPGEQQYEWEPARTITGKQPNRVARLKALGNAVVPQVIALIGASIIDFEMDGDVA